MQLAANLWMLALPNPGGTHHTVNSYLIGDRGGYALVDCGQERPECWTALLQELARLRVPLDAIHTVVVTHGHRDHAGAAARLGQQTGAKVLLHQRELDYMRCRTVDNQAYRQVMVDWLTRYGFPAHDVDEVIRSAREYGGWTLTLEPDRLLSGDEELQLGPYRWRVLWTPGHTPGHVCLFEPDRRWLLCGDHVLPSIRPNVSLQPFSIDDPLRGYFESLRHLAGLGVELALSGHGEPMTKLSDRVDELLAHQARRRRELLALLTPEPRTAYELAGLVWSGERRRAWSSFHGRLRRNAVGTLAAHLEQLAGEGLIARYDDGVVRFARLG